MRKKHSQNSTGSSSLVVHFAEDVCWLDSPFSVMRYQPMKHSISMFQLGWLVIRLVGHRVVTYLSVRPCRVMALTLSTSLAALFRHFLKVLGYRQLRSLTVSCTRLVTLVTLCSHRLSAFIGVVVHLGSDTCHSLPHRLSGFIRGVMREGCDVCSHLHAAEVALRCI